MSWFWQKKVVPEKHNNITRFEPGYACSNLHANKEKNGFVCYKCGLDTGKAVLLSTHGYYYSRMLNDWIPSSRPTYTFDRWLR